MIKGCATADGTQAFFTKHPSIHPESIRMFYGLRLSSIGIGSYLGDPDEATDLAYASALEVAIEKGINVIDTAINYRCQHSERSFGSALQNLIRQGKIKREQIFIATKGGFIPFDGDYPPDAGAYIRQHYLDKGILKPEDIAQGCHAMTPGYLETQLSQSLKNLGLETVDVYYLHNPETQLEAVGRSEFNKRISKAFQWLEHKVQEGKIRYYGTATWNGYRLNPAAAEYLNLSELLVLAREAGGAGHHFRALQLPVNLAMAEAWVLRNQNYGANPVSVLQLAKKSGFFVAASASLLQSRLAGVLPDFLDSFFPNLKKSSHRAIQFARSAAGVTSALVGMKSLSHVEENSEVLKFPDLKEEDLARMFSKRKCRRR